MIHKCISQYAKGGQSWKKIKRKKNQASTDITQSIFTHGHNLVSISFVLPKIWYILVFNMLGQGEFGFHKKSISRPKSVQVSQSNCDLLAVGKKTNQRSCLMKKGLVKNRGEIQDIDWWWWYFMFDCVVVMWPGNDQLLSSVERPVKQISRGVKPMVTKDH